MVFVNTIQVLCHESKIPAKIELHISDEEKISNPRNVSFRRLGHVISVSVCLTVFSHFSLSDNKKTDFKARELKSVTVNENCTVMKLVLHQCFLNELNIFSQVALIAINILGDVRLPLGFLGPGEPAAIDVDASVDLTNLRPAGRRSVRCTVYHVGCYTRDRFLFVLCSNCQVYPGLILCCALYVQPTVADFVSDVAFDSKTAQLIKELIAAKNKAVASAFLF